MYNKEKVSDLLQKSLPDLLESLSGDFKKDKVILEKYYQHFNETLNEWEKSLTSEWITVHTKRGTTYQRRQRKRTKEQTTEENGPHNFAEREKEWERSVWSGSLKDQLMNAVKYEGNYYTSNGDRLLIPRRFKDIVDARYNPKAKNSRVFTKQFLEGAEGTKHPDYEKEHLKQVLPKIKERDAQFREEYEKREQRHNKLEADLEFQQNRVKSSLDTINQQNSSVKAMLRVLNYARTKINEEINPTIELTFQGKKQEYGLDEIIERLKKTETDNETNTGIQKLALKDLQEYELEDFIPTNFLDHYERNPKIHEEIYKKLDLAAKLPKTNKKSAPKKKTPPLQKSETGEGSRGGHVIRHTKTGKPVYGDHATPKTVAKENPKPQWFDKYKQYKLNAYPIGIPEGEVEANTSGDVNSHWVLRWKDPKTGATKLAYTPEFLQRNAQIKWERIQNIDAKQVEGIRKKAIGIVNDPKADFVIKDAAAIVAIISLTGLRRGDKTKMKITGNKGVSTLGPDNIKVEGKTVKLNFVGKSYQENNAEFINGPLAEYLRKRKEEQKEALFLFATNDEAIDKVFNRIGGANIKIKDMRTYVATDLARKILFEDPTPPPPVAEDMPMKKKKALVQSKLKMVFEQVSKKLNNTPAMAKTSYIHPNVINAWLDSLSLNFEIAKAQPGAKEYKVLTLDEIKKIFPLTKTNKVILGQTDEETCNEFVLPSWWE